MGGLSLSAPRLIAFLVALLMVAGLNILLRNQMRNVNGFMFSICLIKSASFGLALALPWDYS